MNTKTVPFHYSLLWLQTAMRVAEQHYSLFLGCSLASVAVTWGVLILPVIGSLASSVFAFVFVIGYFRMTQRIFNGEAVSFDTFLKDTFDTKMFNELLPMAIVSVLSGFSGSFVLLRLPFAAQGLLSLIYISAYLLSIYASFIKINSSLDWQSCYAKAVEGFWKNILTLLVWACVTCSFLIGCAIFLIIPLFAYGLPVLVPMSFLLYNCIFGEMDLDAVHRAWGQKSSSPQIESAPD